MRHLDLFSGIGGFAYAVDQVWDNVDHIFVENDPFCQKVLQKHWSNSLMYDNIKDIAWHLQTQNTKPTGERKTSPKSENTGGTITGETMKNYSLFHGSEPSYGESQNEKQSSMLTDESVRVVERQQNNSSLLTTSMETEQPSENSTELQEHIAELSKQVFPKPTNFSASIVTALKEFSDNVLTRPVDLITGGFPCQPFSAAGLRKGKDDDRFLWPHMLAIIRATNPTWVIAENVRGIINIHNGLVFEQVCADLEAEGYEVQTFIIPAVAVNAPHRRDRIWFVANRQHDGRLTTEEVGAYSRAQPKSPSREKLPVNELTGAGSLRDTQTRRDTTYPRRSSKRSKKKSEWTSGDSSRRIKQSVANTEYKRLEGRNEPTTKHRQDQGVQFRTKDWERNWLEVATELCGVDDGLSEGLDEFGGYTKAQHRVQRLKSLGNAIVPQIAIEIMKAIKEQ